MRVSRSILLLILITFSVYFLSFFNHFVWDDEQFIYNNKFVATFDVESIFTTNTIAGAGEISNYYRPLTTLSFAWDYLFWGLNPVGFHLTNTLLHSLAGVLLYIILKKLKFSEQAAFWLALIFLLHPIQTEAVTYANSRGDSMYTFFGLASILSLLLLFEKKNLSFSVYNLKIKIGWWLFAILTPILYACSILGKEIGIATFGIQLLVVTHLFFSSKKNIFIFLKKNWACVSSVSGSLLIAGFYLFLRATSLNFNNSFNFYDDTSVYSESLLVRLLTFSKIIFIYIRLLLFPYPLHMERDTSLITSVASIWPVMFFVLAMIVIFISVREFKKKHTLYIGFGALWFLIMLAPVSGVIAINGLLYEHWLYVPMIGFFICLYGIYKLYLEKLFSYQLAKRFLIGVAIIFSALTIRQNYLWGTPIRFYSYLLKHTESARIHNNLAMALAEDGKLEDALKEYNLALQYGIPYPNIYHNMANTYSSLGEYEKAEEYYSKAIEVSPYFYHSYFKLIDLYAQQKKYNQALELAKKGQETFPEANDFKVLEKQLLEIEK